MSIECNDVTSVVMEWLLYDVWWSELVEKILAYFVCLHLSSIILLFAANLNLPDLISSSRVSADVTTTIGVYVFRIDSLTSPGFFLDEAL